MVAVGFKFLFNQIYLSFAILHYFKKISKSFFTATCFWLCPECLRFLVTPKGMNWWYPLPFRRPPSMGCRYLELVEIVCEKTCCGSMPDRIFYGNRYALPLSLETDWVIRKVNHLQSHQPGNFLNLKRKITFHKDDICGFYLQGGTTGT